MNDKEVKKLVREYTKKIGALDSKELLRQFKFSIKAEWDGLRETSIYHELLELEVKDRLNI